MSRPDSLASLLSHPETRTASTSLLVIGFLVGGSAAAAAVWWRARRSLSWPRHAVDRSCQEEDGFREDQFICVLDGGSKQCRRDAIEVATCFGVIDVWVVADAGVSDHKDDYQKAENDTHVTSNGHTISVRTFNTAQECCDTLVANGWVVCIASTKPEQTGTRRAADKQAIVVAEPFPSQPFVQAAQQEMEADLAQPDDSGRLPAAAALALTLHHLMGGRSSQSSKQQSRADAKELPHQQHALPLQAHKPSEHATNDASPQSELPRTSSQGSTGGSPIDSHIESDRTPEPQPPPLSDSDTEPQPGTTPASPANSDNEKQSDTNSHPAQPPAAGATAATPIRSEDSVEASTRGPSNQSDVGADVQHALVTQQAAEAAGEGRAQPGADPTGPGSPSSSQAADGAKANSEGSSQADTEGGAHQSPFYPSVPTDPARFDRASDTSSLPAGSSVGTSGFAASGTDGFGADTSEITAATTGSSQDASSSSPSAMAQAAAAQAAQNASKIKASEMSRLQAQAMRRSGVLRRHGMGTGTSSRASSSMGSPTGSVASISTAGWPEHSPA